MTDSPVGIRISLKGKAETTKGLRDVAKDILGVGEASKRAEHSSEGFLKSMIKYQLGYGAMSLVTRGVKDLVGGMVRLGTTTALQNQMAEVSFKTLLGSTKAANKEIHDLHDFANKTPFDFSDLQKSASQLIAVGVNAKEIIPIMTSLGNSTAAMGTGSQGINRAVTAIEKMNAAQAIHAQNLNELRLAGVPVYQLLSAALGKSQKQVEDLASHGKLGADALQKMMLALENGKGLARFNGLMMKQSHTLSGEMSNLHDIVADGLGDAVKPWLPAGARILGAISNISDPFFKKMQAMSRGFAAGSPHAISEITGELHNLGPQAEGAWKWIHNLALSFEAGFLTANSGGLKSATSGIKELAGALKSAVPSTQTLRRFSRDLGEVFGFVSAHAHLLDKAVGPLVRTLLVLKAVQWGLGKAILEVKGVLRGVRLAMDAYRIATEIWLGISKASAIYAGLQTLAMEGQAIAWGDLTLALKVATIVTKIQTAGQWLLNAAMDANPIGLVVLAVVALVAGVYEAYKHFKWFRDIVQDVWKALKATYEWGKRAAEWLVGSGGNTKKTVANTNLVTGHSLRTVAGAKASGGFVNAGSLYQVNEQNRRETFMPAVNGRIIPASLDGDQDGGVAGGAVTIGELHVHSHLDGKEITESVLKNVRGMVARK